MKLHLACGKKRLPEFTHVDIRPEVEPDVVADISSMPMFKDNTADVIYLCHGLEHFTLKETPAVLKEWQRILKPGGWLYLAVPDFGAIASEYVFGRVPLRKLWAALIGAQDYPENTHYSVWDLALLREELQKAGFTDVQRYDAWEFTFKHYFDFSKYKQGGVLLSLNVRARAEKRKGGV